MKITMLLVLNSSREARRGTVGFASSQFFSPPLPFFFQLLQRCFLHVCLCQLCQCHTTRGLCQSRFHSHPWLHPLGWKRRGLSLVVSTHVILGGVQKDDIFHRLLAPDPLVLLIFWMFKKKISFSVSKEQSSRMSTKNAGFNVIKPLKLNQIGLFFLTPAQESKYLSPLPREVQRQGLQPILRELLQWMGCKLTIHGRASPPCVKLWSHHILCIFITASAFWLDFVRGSLFTSPWESMGPDRIHPRTEGDVIAGSLSIIHQRSQECREIPADWKLGSVTPIYKQCVREEPKELQSCQCNLSSQKNYREDYTGYYRNAFKEQCSHQPAWVPKGEVLFNRLDIL